jgi:hypothetical protein
LPTIRKLYTLQEVKELLAKKNNVHEKDVDVFENRTIEISDILGNSYEVEDNSYLFQVDTY